MINPFKIWWRYAGPHGPHGPMAGALVFLASMAVAAPPIFFAISKIALPLLKWWWAWWLP